MIEHTTNVVGQSGSSLRRAGVSVWSEYTDVPGGDREYQSGGDRGGDRGMPIAGGGTAGETPGSCTDIRADPGQPGPRTEVRSLRVDGTGAAGNIQGSAA